MNYRMNGHDHVEYEMKKMTIVVQTNTINWFSLYGNLTFFYSIPDCPLLEQPVYLMIRSMAVNCTTSIYEKESIKNILL